MVYIIVRVLYLAQITVIKTLKLDLGIVFLNFIKIKSKINYKETSSPAGLRLINDKICLRPFPLVFGLSQLKIQHYL